MSEASEKHGRADEQRVTTWAMLAAKWTQFAQAAVALPEDAGTSEGGRWREAVPSVIELQAMVHALGELDELADGDRVVALDKAELVCRRAARQLHELWRGEELPAEIAELVQDARVAFEAAANAGVEWVASSERLELGHPTGLIEQLLQQGFAGELFLAMPGVPMFRGAPVAFARGPGGARPGAAVEELIGRFVGWSRDARKSATSGPARAMIPRQVYRQMDVMKGGPVRDVVAAMSGELPAGQPLLALVIDGGVGLGVPMMPMGGRRVETLPVEFAG